MAAPASPERTALVFSGGGAHSAFQAGVAAYLYDHGFDNRIFAGTSAGAMNAAFLAQTPAIPRERKLYASRLVSLWERIDASHVYREKFGSVAASLVFGLWRPGLFDPSPLRHLIYSIIDPHGITQSGCKLRVMSCGLRTGAIKVATEHDADIVDWVYRSGLFPGILMPDEAHGEQWADGGIREQTPVAAAVAAGADRVIVASTFLGVRGRLLPPVESALGGAARAIEWILEEAESNDLAVLDKRNALAAAGVSGHRHIDLTVIRPRKDFVKHAFDFDHEGMAAAAAHGYMRAMSALGDSQSPNL